MEQKVIPWTEIRRRSLYVATPMYGGLATTGFINSMIALSVVCARHGISFYNDFMANESLIQRARNYLADNFMRSGFTHLMFIDADIEFNPDDVIHMLAIADYHSPYDVLVGAYPKKMIAWEKVLRAAQSGKALDKEGKERADLLSKYVGDFVFNFAPNEKGEVIINTGTPTPVREGGTGFMMIQRRTLEKYADEYPEALYRPDHKRSEHFNGKRLIMEYFPVPIDRGVSEYEIWKLIRKAAKGQKITEEARKAVEAYEKASLRLWSEDYAFCQFASKIGTKIWLLPWIKLTHYGTYPFAGDLDAILSAGSHPTMGSATVQRLPSATPQKQRPMINLDSLKPLGPLPSLAVKPSE